VALVAEDGLQDLGGGEVFHVGEEEYNLVRAEGHEILKIVLRIPRRAAPKAGASALTLNDKKEDGPQKRIGAMKILRGRACAARAGSE
jgi:hypothetical protein